MARIFFLIFILPLLLNAKVKDDLLAVDLLTVHPTQASVGFSEVDRKVQKLLAMTPSERREFVLDSAPEAVLGPGNVVYILDKHHEFSAMLRVGFKKAYVHIKKDYSDKTPEEFEEKMIEKGYVYLRSENNRIISFKSLAQSLSELKDDPYRSLAGELRRAGGFKHTDVRYAEFLWAQQLRQVVTRKILREDPDRALRLALSFARSLRAQELPGAKSMKNMACSRTHVLTFKLLAN